MSAAVLSAALLIGFAGSLHCVGMCGPLAMIVPLRNNRWMTILVYNLSRLLVYATLGFVFGALGARLSFLESGQRISLVLGIAVLMFFVVPTLVPKWSLAARWNMAVTKMFGKVARPVMQYRGWASPILLGMLNGILPCGLIYISLAGAVASGTGTSGALLMVAIGAGTLPAMVSMMALRRYFKQWMQRSSRWALPVVAGILGMGLMMRGLNLDVPYLSPKIEKVTTATGEECQ